MLHFDAKMRGTEYMLDGLLLQYGKLIEEKIKNAGSQEEAEEFVKQIDTAFQHQCLSREIRGLFTLYVIDLLQKYWGVDNDHKRYLN